MSNEEYNILEYERTVLSSLIFEPQHRENLFGTLKKSDFSSVAHQNLFQACFSLEKQEKPIDDVFIQRELERDNKWDEMAYLVVISALPRGNIDAYKKVIIEYSRGKQYKLEMALIMANQKDLSIDEVNAQVHMLSKKFSENEDISVDEFKMGDLEDIEEEEAIFFLKEFMPIQKNEVNLFSGKGGSGKSFLNLLLLAKLNETYYEDRTLKCFGFFSEDAKGIVKKRCNTLMESDTHDISFNGVMIAGKSAKKESFVMRDKTTGLPTESPYFRRFKRAMKDFDIILIDPLIAFFGLDENSNGEIRYFMDLLNHWCETENKTILLIHHHSKSGTSRGASALIDAVRMHYEISADVNEDGLVINSHMRLSKLVKNNHWRGETDFKFQLFRDYSKVSTGEEFVYDGGDEVSVASKVMEKDDFKMYEETVIDFSKKD